MSDYNPIFKDGILIDIFVSFWTASKKLRPEDMGLKAEDVAQAYKLGKKMLIPANVIQAFRAIETRARRLHAEASFEFPVGRSRFVPKNQVVKLIKALMECRDKYMALVEDLVANYDKYRQEMLPMYQEAAEIAYARQLPATREFGMEYDPVKEKTDFIKGFMDRIATYYPPAEELRGHFSLTWDMYQTAMPEMVEIEADKIIKKEAELEIFKKECRERTQKKVDAFAEDVVKVLRSETVEICDRIATNLKEGKVIKGKTLHSLKDFIDRFQELNFVGDFNIQNQLQSLREKVLDAYPADTIADDMNIQEELKRRLGKIVEDASSITDINSITGEYRRKIQWNA